MKKFISFLLSTLILITTCTSTALAVDVTDFNTVSEMPFTIFGLCEGNAVQISSESLNLHGNISSNGSVSINTHIQNIIGCVEENSERFIIDSLEEQLTVNNTYSVSRTEYENDIYYLNEDRVSEDIVLSGKNISIAEKKQSQNFYSYCENFKTLNDTFLFTKSNITINCKNLYFKGVIYCPEGEVTINCETLDFSGLIIADTIRINCKNITIDEGREIQNVLYNFDEKKMDEFCAIEERYEELKSQLKNYNTADMSESEYIEVYLEYQRLRQQLIDDGTILSDKEAAEFFEAEYIKYQEAQINNSKLRSTSDFYPLRGIEGKYEVKRKRTTTTYQGKKYQYYTIDVSDKITTESKYLYKFFSDSVLIQGKINTQEQAREFIDKAVYKFISGKISDIVSKYAGAIAESTIAILLENFGATYDKKDFSTSANNYTINDIGAKTCIRYTWTYFDNYGWVYSYCCNYVKYNLTHHFSFYGNQKKGKDVYIPDTISFRGDFFKPYMGVRKAVDYYQKTGSLTNGSYYPLAMYNVGPLIITDVQGKKHIYPPHFYPNTTHLAFAEGEEDYL